MPRHAAIFSPRPVPETISDRKSRFLFFILAWGGRSKSEPWFVAADVCKVLGLGNSSQAIAKLDDDEKSGVIISDPHGREQVTRFISESGLYTLVLSSRKPEAKAFKRWITHEQAYRRTKRL